MTETCATCRAWGKGRVRDYAKCGKFDTTSNTCDKAWIDNDDCYVCSDIAHLTTHKDFACNQWEGRE